MGGVSLGKLYAPAKLTAQACAVTHLKCMPCWRMPTPAEATLGVQSATPIFMTHRLLQWRACSQTTTWSEWTLGWWRPGLGAVLVQGVPSRFRHWQPAWSLPSRELCSLFNPLLLFSSGIIMIIIILMIIL